jgi:hypothetical protein
MLSALSRSLIKRMEKRYDCDMSYLLYLLAKAPRAFRKFMRVGALSRHRERAPTDAAFTVQLLATMHEDCGPCLQLVVQLAEEAKMQPDQIEAVLTSDTAAMHAAVSLAYRYADAVLNRRAAIAEIREAVRGQWGDSGLIDLAMNLQGVRVYPMLKLALGFAAECQRVNVRGRWINLKKAA